MSTEPKADKLHTHIRAAYIWTIAGNLTKQVVGVGISVLLARFLQPSDYGLLGMVWVFIAILSSIQDLGFGSAIVHFDDDDSVISTYFSTTLVLGLVLTGLSFAAAPLVAYFYHEPRLTHILRVLSITLAITSFQSVATGVLSKQFRFRELTMVEMSSTIIAGIIAVFLAWRGWGVWALVTNLLLWTSLQTALLCRAVPPRFTLHPRKDVLPKVLRYGLPLTSAGLLHQFYDNADYLVVGRMVGATALGYYTLAFRLATLAHEKIAAVVNKVAFPSFAAMQREREQVVDHWFAVSRSVSLIIFPLLLMLFINAKDAVLVVFGEKWLPAVVPLRFLCVVGVLRSLVHIVLHIFAALGDTRARLQFGIVNAVLLPISFFIGCKYGGLRGVGIAWCIVYPLIWIYVLVKVRRILPFSFFRYFVNLRLPALFTAACFASMIPAEWVHGSALIRLVVRSALGGITYALCVLSRPRIRSEVMALVSAAGGFRRKAAVSA